MAFLSGVHLNSLIVTIVNYVETLKALKLKDPDLAKEVQQVLRSVIPSYVPENGPGVAGVNATNDPAVLETARSAIATLLIADKQKDPRNILSGTTISASAGYQDQPQIVITKNGTWNAVITSNSGHEGQSSQSVVSTTSTNHGVSWSPLVVRCAFSAEIYTRGCHWFPHLLT
jgi:hypothetical protein